MQMRDRSTSERGRKEWISRAIQWQRQRVAGEHSERAGSVKPPCDGRQARIPAGLIRLDRCDDYLFYAENLVPQRPTIVGIGSFSGTHAANLYRRLGGHIIVYEASERNFAALVQATVRYVVRSVSLRPAEHPVIQLSRL